MQFCILSDGFCTADGAKCNPESAKEIDPASVLDLSTNYGLLDRCPQYEIRPTLYGFDGRYRSDCALEMYERLY